MTRATSLLAAALLLTVLAHFGLPLSPDDPLRSTLVVLPLVLAAVVELGRWAAERGGRCTPSPIIAAEAVLLAALVLITAGRHHLGLTPADTVERCLAGGFALLLMHRLSWLVLSLRPALGGKLPERPPSPFFALPFVVYLAILPWTAVQHPPDGDAPHYLLLTHSLAHDLDTDLRNNYENGDSLRFIGRRLEPQFGDPVGNAGELYSRHNVLLPLLLAPFYRLGELVGVLVAMAILTAATCWLTLALAQRYEDRYPGAALLVWTILAFSAPLLLFSYQVWVEIPAALLVLVALIEIRDLQRTGGRGWGRWVGLAMALLLLPLLKIRFLLIAVPLAGLAIWHSGRRARRGAVALAVILVALTVGILLFNLYVFQNPLKYHDIDGLRGLTYPPSYFLRGFTGLFFDCAFGLFASAPIWTLLLPAAVIVLWRNRLLAFDFIFVFVTYLFLLSPRGEWFGAWSPPYRYGVVMLPVLALWLIPLLAARHRAGSRFVISVLAVFTVVVTTLWLVEPGWTYNLAHGRSHLLDQLSTRLSADVARFFPSSTRLRAASYVWPPLAFAVVSLSWRLGRQRTARTTVLWAVAASLLAPALVAWAAQHRATRIVELEDPWIGQRAGRVYPDLWIIYRPAYRGGWTLPAEASLHVPVVAGGDRLDLAVELFLAPGVCRAPELEVSDTESRLPVRLEIREEGEWTAVQFEELSWSAGRELTLTLRDEPSLPGGQCHAILDRAEIRWGK